MTAMPATELMTAEQFLSLPLDMDEYGVAPCLVEGELVVNRPNLEHQDIFGTIYHELRDWIDTAPGRGFAIQEIDLLIDELNVYEPDVLWYAEGRQPSRADVAPYPIPDLAVEVRSPSTWRHDIGAKKAGYERKGLPELWLVDTPASEVLVFRRSTPQAPTFDLSLELSAGDVLESPLLEGFALPIDQLFAAY